MFCFITVNQLKIETQKPLAHVCAFFLSENNLFAKQSAHLDFPLIFLFFIMTSFFGHILSVCFLHPKQ